MINGLLPTIVKVVGLLGMFYGTLSFLGGDPSKPPSVWTLIAMIGGGALFLASTYFFGSPRRSR